MKNDGLNHQSSRHNTTFYRVESDLITPFMLLQRVQIHICASYISGIFYHSLIVQLLLLKRKQRKIHTFSSTEHFYFQSLFSLAFQWFPSPWPIALPSILQPSISDFLVSRVSMVGWSNILRSLCEKTIVELSSTISPLPKA